MQSSARQDNLFRRSSKKNKCECKCKYRRSVLECVCVRVYVCANCQHVADPPSPSPAPFAGENGPTRVVACTVWNPLEAEGSKRVAARPHKAIRGERSKRKRWNRVDCFSSVLLAWHLNYLRLCQHLEFHKFWPVDACQIASGRLHTRST